MNALQKNRTETIARSRGGGKGHATQSNGRHWPRRRTLIKSLCTFPHSGAIAQLGERIVRNDEVVGSIPTSSTIFSNACRLFLPFRSPEKEMRRVRRSVWARQFRSGFIVCGEHRCAFDSGCSVTFCHSSASTPETVSQPSPGLYSVIATATSVVFSPKSF